jgi:hypothetical protein
MKVFVELGGDWYKMNKIDAKYLATFAKNIIEWYQQRFEIISAKSTSSSAANKQDLPSKDTCDYIFTICQILQLIE